MRSSLPRTELFLVLACVQLLLLSPAIINWLVRTPPADDRLILAAWTGDRASLEDALAEIEAAQLRSGTGEDALASAAMTGKTEVVGRLLDLGVNVNALDQFGATPLMHAAMLNRHEMVQLLLSRGADSEMRLPANGFTVTQIAANAGADKSLKVLRRWSKQPRQGNP